MFLKVGGKYFSWPDINFLEEDYLSEAYPGHQTVRFQYRTRQDEEVVVGGRPLVKKHGVYELPPEFSEEMRWLLATLGPQLGVTDVSSLYKQRDSLTSMQGPLTGPKSPSSHGKPFLVPRPAPPALPDATGDSGDVS